MLVGWLMEGWSRCGVSGGLVDGGLVELWGEWWWVDGGGCSAERRQARLLNRPDWAQKATPSRGDSGARCPRTVSGECHTFSAESLSEMASMKATTSTSLLLRNLDSATCFLCVSERSRERE